MLERGQEKELHLDNQCLPVRKYLGLRLLKLSEGKCLSRRCRDSMGGNHPEWGVVLQR